MRWIHTVVKSQAMNSGDALVKLKKKEVGNNYKMMNADNTMQRIK